VLAVHRDQLAAAAPQRLAHQRPAGHQRLLVGQRQPLAGQQRRQRRLSPAAPTTALMTMSASGCVAASSSAAARADAAGPAARSRGRRPRPRARRMPGACRAPPAARARRVAVGRERDDAELVGCRSSTLSALRPMEPVEPSRATPVIRPAPRSRGSSDSSQYVTGIVKKSESKRSSTPPWPGSSAPESLTPASRLSSDSARSPSCATGETTRPATRRTPCPAAGRASAEHEVRVHRAGEDRADHAGDGALHRLGRAHGRDQLPPAERPPAEVRRGVAHPREDQREQQQRRDPSSAPARDPGDAAASSAAAPRRPACRR
jgi:hypothetical protein